MYRYEHEDKVFTVQEHPAMFAEIIGNKLDDEGNKIPFQFEYGEPKTHVVVYGEWESNQIQWKMMSEEKAKETLKHYQETLCITERDILKEKDVEVRVSYMEIFKMTGSYRLAKEEE